MESQFWGSPKALEGQRQSSGTEGAREGAEVHSHSWEAWLCALHLVYVINHHYNPSKSVPHHPHFTDKEAEAWRTARIVKISHKVYPETGHSPRPARPPGPTHFCLSSGQISQ